MRIARTAALIVFVACLCRAQNGEWPSYGGDPGGTRYSPLKQITRENVHKLKVAWTYRTGDVSDGSRWAVESAFEATPILVEGALYLPTPFNRVVALDPERGTVRWRYDPKISLEASYGDGFVCRGVATWLDRNRPAGQACRRRIFIATLDARLISLDAATGAPCQDFGKDGQVDLSAGVPAYLAGGAYHMTSPPAVIGGLVVVGSSINDNMRAEMPGGIVRAYDARTGALRWSWNPVPPGKTGAANAWSIISVDPARDLLFVPTGSASPDFYGGQRSGTGLYADSVVALRGSTGEVVWHFQVVHHDLWDYDVASQPALVTVRRGGKRVAAVAQATKMGNLFFLDRGTGKPLFPVEEHPAPASTVEGERAWPTQPFPAAPPPLAPQRLSLDDVFGITAGDRDWCRDRLKALRHGEIFTPPSLEGTVIFPGNIGGMNWSSVAFDPERGLLVTNTNRLATIVKLIPREQFKAVQREYRGVEVGRQEGTPYVSIRDWFLTPGRVPCNAPPWGTLAAVDVSEGRLRWEVPLGTMPQLAQVPESSKWGSVNLGGAIVTAGGLVFIAAAWDNYLRAFDIESGKELWKGALPAGGQATPMTYQLSKNGKQYVVIAAGGHGRMRTTLGDHVVAFTLQ